MELGSACPRLDSRPWLIGHPHASELGDNGPLSVPDTRMFGLGGDHNHPRRNSDTGDLQAALRTTPEPLQ